MIQHKTLNIKVDNNLQWINGLLDETEMFCREEGQRLQTYEEELLSAHPNSWINVDPTTNQPFVISESQ